MNDKQDEPLYEEDRIPSGHAKVPKFLIAVYIILPIWGLLSMYYYWNGSTGWLDRGYWKQLQIAANTTFPIENQNMPENNSGTNTETKANVR
jgi:hypothetical protein